MTSKTKYKADKIRKVMNKLISKGKLNLGFWTPDRLSNRCVLKYFGYLRKKRG